MNNPLSKVTVGMYEIHSRILSTSSKCYKAGNFTDFTISTPNGITFKCNKIIFCHQSTWFYNYFKNNQENEILLPFCDDTTVESFISFFYDGKIVLNQSNVIVYLKYAIFYEVEKLQMIVDLFLGRAVNQTNVLHFVKSMISNGLSKYACKYSQMLADILLKDKDALRTQLFSIITSDILYMILRTPKVQEYFGKQKIIEFIDEFDLMKPITSIEDKDNLESLIDWNDKSSYMYFTKYQCNWVTPKTSRKFYSKILDVRRNDNKIFQNESSNAGDKIFRWYPYLWIHNIALAIEVDKSPNVNIVEFFSTLGILKQPINPYDFGFLQISSTPPISNLFLAKNALKKDDSYFLSQDMMFETNKSPFFSIYIDKDAKFLPNEITIYSNIKIKLSDYEYRIQPYPQTVKLTGENSDGKLVDIITSLPFIDGIAKSTYRDKSTFTKFIITMNGEEKGGGNVLRIRALDINGRFLPN